MWLLNLSLTAAALCCGLAAPYFAYHTFRRRTPTVEEMGGWRDYEAS